MHIRTTSNETKYSVNYFGNFGQPKQTQHLLVYNLHVASISHTVIYMWNRSLDLPSFGEGVVAYLHTIWLIATKMPSIVLTMRESETCILAKRRLQTYIQVERITRFNSGEANRSIFRLGFIKFLKHRIIFLKKENISYRCKIT